MKTRPNKRPGALVLTGLAYVLATAGTAGFSDQAAGDDSTAGSTWKFTVYLDDKKIGYHHFFHAESGQTRQLKSVASFDYSLMFIRLFRYRHENNEIWNGDCLQSINSRTDSNGETFRVHGRRSAGEFRVSANGSEESLPDCVMSFAYWNPAFLEQSRLLNSQDGELLEVAFTGPVFEALEAGGTPRPAWRYHLVAGDLKLDLWYSAEREWLALESEVRGGRKLRYVREEADVQAGGHDLHRPSFLARSGPVDLQRGD